MDAEYHGTACRKYEALLEDLLNGELGAADANSLREHIKECNGCRNALEAAAQGARLLRMAEPTPDPGPGFAHLVMARIRVEESALESKSILQPLVSLAWKFAATAALGLAVLITYDTVGNSGAPSTAYMSRQAETRDIFSTDPVTPPRSADDVLMLVAETNHGHH
jgi:anti-sigma factor RsiW